MPVLSFIVPCFNEEDMLPLALPRLLAAGAATAESFEVVLIDDGSTDRTWDGIVTAAKQHAPLVRGLRFARNFGQPAAIFAGLAHARGDFALLVDADLQDPPELAPDMLARARDGFDLVCGVRRSRAGERWTKRMTAWIFNRVLTWIAPRPIPVDSGYFYLLSRRACDALVHLPGRDRYLRVLLSLVDYPRTTFVYDRAARVAGATKYTWGQLLRLAMHALRSCLRRPTQDQASEPALYEIREATP